MHYDLIIIGGGAAGFAAAHRAEKSGIKTLMVNDPSVVPLGGTCVNVGCIPSKIMLHQAGLIYSAMKNTFRALSFSGRADFVEALSETREMVKGFQEKNYQKVLSTQKYVSYIEGHARFVGPRKIEVSGRLYEAEYFLIATGASTFVPPVEGINQVPYLTNRTVFNLGHRPHSVIILGGGSEAVEFSQIFHRFGIKTTLIQRSPRILTKFDSLVATNLQEILSEEGINIITDTVLKGVKKGTEGIEVIYEKRGEGEKTERAEEILIATGLRGNTDGMELEHAGVETTERGFVKVDQYLQTSNPHIYAAGDVTGTVALETVAARQGSVSIKNMFETEKEPMNYYLIPRAVFTSPELASVGLTEEEFMKKYNTCLCRSISLEHVERAALMKETGGLIRMVVHPETKEIAGVQMVGPHASEVITTATYAIKNRMTIYDIRDTMHIFPTVSEAIKKVAQSFDEDIGKMPCCIE